MHRLLGLLFLILISSCGGGRPPFLMVQLCLKDSSDMDQFMSLMKSISASNGMTFIDRSSLTRKELKELKVSPNYRIINISGDDGSGVGWSAGNFALSGHEIAIGFSEGANPERARQFSEEVINVLNQKWDVHRVPPNKGATPICKP